MKNILALCMLLIGVIAFSGTVTGGTGKSAVQVSVQCDQDFTSPAFVITPEYCFATTDTIETVPVLGDVLIEKPCNGFAKVIDHPPGTLQVNRLNNNLFAANMGYAISIGNVEPRTDVPPLLMRCRSGDVITAELTALRAHCDGSIITSDETAMTNLNTGIIHSWFDIDTQAS